MRSKVRHILVVLATLTMTLSIALPIQFHLRSGARDLTRQSPPSSASARPDTVPTRTALVDKATRTRITDTYMKLPLRFEANQGQTDQTVKYISRGPGYSLFLTSG